MPKPCASYNVKPIPRSEKNNNNNNNNNNNKNNSSSSSSSSNNGDNDDDNDNDKDNKSKNNNRQTNEQHNCVLTGMPEPGEEPQRLVHDPRRDSSPVPSPHGLLPADRIRDSTLDMMFEIRTARPIKFLMWYPII
eukprot:jgi/Botrbrau1/8431/Bobra.0237s0050.1